MDESGSGCDSGWVPAEEHRRPVGAHAHRFRKMDDRAEAHQMALARGPAPEGHRRCNLRLLADRMVDPPVVESLPCAGWGCAGRNALKPFQKRQWRTPGWSPTSRTAWRTSSARGSDSAQTILRLSPLKYPVRLRSYRRYDSLAS